MADIFAHLEGRQGPPEPTPLNHAASRLDRLTTTRAKRDPVTQEIQRIVQLQRVPEVTDEEVEAFCRENVRADAFDAGFRLFKPQVGAVIAYDLYEGGFFPIGVGFGKTLVSLMIAERAYRAGIRKSLLLVPSQVYAQLTGRDVPWARKRVPLSVPLMGLGAIGRKKRLAFARSDRDGCYILPYSCLSTPDSDDLLRLIDAGLIIADEAHLLKNAKAARTKRVRRFIDKKHPQMVAMSGTITSKSIVDYWHLIRACLGDNCPLPLSSHLIRQWSGVLDAQSSGWGSSEDYSEGSEFRVEPIMPLVRWAKRHWPDEDFPETVRGFRRAYKHRLVSAPGVVVTGDNEIGTSLVMHNEPIKRPERYEGWPELEELIRRVEMEYVAPNGDEIDHAIHAFGWLYQLTSGFYNDLYWPAAEVLAEEREIRPSDAEDLLEAAKFHHKLLQFYHSTLRKWLGARSKPGLDTPFLVASEMERSGHKNVGRELYDAWRAAKDAEFDGMPGRRSRPIRVCGYKVFEAADWAGSLPPGVGAILWVHHQEIGRWLVEALKRRDLPVLHCPAGNQSNEAIIDPANGDKLVVASISAHGTGKNLQHFEQQYVVQWPRSAVVAEQMLGRLHRTGQLADELVVHTANTTDTDALNFAACLNDSLYIHDTTSVRQKLMFASYDPPPTVYDPSILKRHGLDPKRLTGEQLTILREKFGE